MGKGIKRKLGGRAGESLAEVLVALLVSTIGILLLASMIQSANMMIVSSRSHYRDYIEAENALESQSGGGREDHINILLDGSAIRLTDESQYNVGVICYSNAANGGKTIVSYRVSGDAT